MSSSNSYRRARPLLGTIVEIRADAPPAAADRAIVAGFAAIERTEALMSVHAADSELSRLRKSLRMSGAGF